VRVVGGRSSRFVDDGLSPSHVLEWVTLSDPVQARGGHPLWPPPNTPVVSFTVSAPDRYPRDTMPS
jgi:hypothetical protein